MKILHIVSEIGGGVGAVLFNYFSRIDKNSYSADFIVHGKKEGEYQEYFENIGSKVTKVTPKNKSILKNFTEIRNHIKKGNYDIIHCHQGVDGYLSSFAAKCAKAKCIIVHSHGAPIEKGRSRIFNAMKRKIIFFSSHLFFACGKAAAKSLMGKKFLLTPLDDIEPYNSKNKKERKVYLVRNAVQINKFFFSEEKRLEVRNSMGISESTFLIGTVGRIAYPKNQEYLLDILLRLQDKERSYALVIVGGGEGKSALIEKAAQLELSSSVHLVGHSTAPEDYLSAMDIFILPSLHEGFALSLLEAQINSLVCLSSDTVPNDALVKDITFLPLPQIELFVSNIENTRLGYSRAVNGEPFVRKGFDINIESKKLLIGYKILSGEKMC